MLILPVLLFSINPSGIRHAPAGTEVHIRLTTTVGSYASRAGTSVSAAFAGAIRTALTVGTYASRAGTSVSAVLIPPVKADGETVLPAGSAGSGRVKRDARVGLGIRHETASLDLEFNQVALPGRDPVALRARVAEVDNARERVTRDGR